MNIKKIIFLLALLLILGAPSCRQSDTKIPVMSVGKVAITTDVNDDNSPVLELSDVLDRAAVIYSSVEIINGQSGNRVEVAWKNISTGQVLATEWFIGKRQEGSPHDFLVETPPVNSWLVSSLSLAEISWPRGEYEVEVQLNHKLAKKVGFKIVSEQEFNVTSKKAMVKSLYLGEKINSQSQVITPQIEFSRTTPRIYAVALMSGVPKDTVVEATWRHWESGQIISKYTTKFTGSGYVPFRMDLDRIGSQWSKGTYTVAIFVDNVKIASKDFTIK